MTSIDEFKELTTVPASIDEVIWDGLETSFYKACCNSLEELTAACKDASKMKVSFCVGAGISYFPPSQLPLANDVVTRLFELCRLMLQPDFDSDIETILKEYNKKERYVFMENMLQELYEAVGAESFQTGYIFNVPRTPARYNLNHMFLARWLNDGLGTVLTSNLDPLIEHAWLDLTKKPISELFVAKRVEQFDDWDIFIEEPNTLWKLHGSADDPKSWAITLSKVGFDLRDARAALIRHVVSDHNTCFIGYRAADADLYPPILASHSRDNRDTQLYWAFYVKENARTLENYLETEQNIARLFENNPAHFRPMITTAERLCAWLQSECLAITPTIPTDKSTVPYPFQHWIEHDLSAAGRLNAVKLSGYALRTLGKHEQSAKVFDQAAEPLHRQLKTLPGQHLITLKRQVGALIQESAHSLWQGNNFADAWAKVKEAWHILCNSKAPLDRAWCQYGRVTMPIDMKRKNLSPVTKIEFLQAIIRLIFLHAWFKLLAWQFRLNGTNIDSPIIGMGLCILYEVKLLEYFTNKMSKIEILKKPIVSLLLHMCQKSEHLFRQAEHVNSLPDIKRRRAYIIRYVNQDIAVTEMIEQVRVAQIISQAHYDVAIDGAEVLLQKITNPDAHTYLEDFIDKQPR